METGKTISNVAPPMKLDLLVNHLFSTWWVESFTSFLYSTISSMNNFRCYNTLIVKLNIATRVLMQRFWWSWVLCLDMHWYSSSALWYFYWKCTFYCDTKYILFPHFLVFSSIIWWLNKMKHNRQIIKIRCNISCIRGFYILMYSLAFLTGN